MYNYTIDRYGIFQEPDAEGYLYISRSIKGIFPYTQLPYFEFKKESKYIKNNPHSVVVMGSSRVGTSVDIKTWENISGKPISKFVIPGMSLPVMLKSLKTLIDKGAKPSRIVIGLDDSAPNNKPIQQGLNMKLYPNGLYDSILFFKDYLFQTINLDHMADFIKTKEKIKYQAYYYGERPNRSDRFSENHKNYLFSMNTGVTIDPDKIDGALYVIKKIKELSDSNNIELDIFFTPMWVTRAYQTNYKEILIFKKKLSKITPFYDFSGISGPNILPEYWEETAHYNPALGNLIAKTIFNTKAFTDKLWGRYVDNNNIDRHLDDLKKNFKLQVDWYLRNKPDGIIREYKILFDKYEARHFNLIKTLKINEEDWNLPRIDSKSFWSAKKEVGITVPVLKNTKHIKLYIVGAPKTYFTSGRKSRRLRIHVNGQYYGDVTFGIGRGLTNKKAITIIGGFDKETKITLTLPDLYRQIPGTKSKDTESIGFLLENRVTKVNYIDSRP